ncbi:MULTISPECIES: phage tail family protein [Bacillus]|uniref:Phage tail family protein n=4 Tax=Bacillus TaxID=1386 RepID=A0AA90JAA0_9BACI|nr:MULTISPECIES: phage tail family protein [Bacillus]MCY7912281.1 phage tail family protein [Bacillus haynesii]MCY7928077.1 phage tail family protein [Bacillus haynesii]MCY7999383.1 phage tail family protein [Bacillus haynesii]MCY8013686.1 phage tail family protein [Bacillus haynesii]MCY8772408.1 phage tail family protein [Bacillus haynesii]
MNLYLDFNNGLGEQSLSSLLPHFKLLSFTPDSPAIERETVKIPRINGLVLPQHPRDVVFKERSIKVEILLNSIIAENFYQYRRELYALLVKPFPYYISTDLLPNLRFLVTCDGNFSIQKDKQKNQTSFTVEFNNVTGLAESKFTSLTKQNFHGEYWSPGMNIQMRDDLEYRFKNRKRFQVYNTGDAYINPLEHDYNVTLWAAGKNVTIINHTNGEKLKIEQELKKSQRVSFIKQYTVISNKPIKTSGRLPGLDVGMNEFEIQNTNDFEIIFDTRFYYA